MGAGTGIELKLPEDIVRGVRFEVPQVVVAWGGDEPEAFEVGGQRIVVPAHNQVSDPERDGSIFRHPPATLGGQPIPGTVLLKTEYRTDPATGSKITVFDAQAVQDFLMGEVRTRNAEALVNRGMVALRNPEDVARVMKTLREAYEEATAVSDQRLLSQERDRLRKFEEQGIPPTPSQIDGLLRKAMERNARRVARGQENGLGIAQIEAAMGIQRPAAPAKVATEAAKVDTWPAGVVDHCLREAQRRKIGIPPAVLLGLARCDQVAAEALVELISTGKEA